MPWPPSPSPAEQPYQCAKYTRSPVSPCLSRPSTRRQRLLDACWWARLPGIHGAMAVNLSSLSPSLSSSPNASLHPACTMGNVLYLSYPRSLHTTLTDPRPTLPPDPRPVSQLPGDFGAACCWPLARRDRRSSRVTRHDTTGQEARQEPSTAQYCTAPLPAPVSILVATVDAPFPQEPFPGHTGIIILAQRSLAAAVASPLGGRGQNLDTDLELCLACQNKQPPGTVQKG